ncbi:hypothetical protein [Anaerovibrio sp.]|uniref:hypothetical protein n=1 Tax=Anaerovibrio sp. TaxID=1872532 RepID=UPI00388F7E5D
MKMDSVQNNSNVLWQQAQEKKKSNKGVPVSDEFSKMLQNMREYKPANYDDSIKVDDKTTVTTQVLSDGSTLTTVRKEGKIISQSKTPATHPEKNPTVISTETVKGLKQEDEEQSQNVVSPDVTAKTVI